MTPMFRAIRTAVVVLLTGIVSAGSALAPEHVHERDDHHPNATVHRHFAPHHTLGSSDGARLDDDDDHVVWLITAWLQTAVYQVPDFASALAAAPVTPALGVRWTALVLDDTAPPHGPPRAPRSLRAPPLPA